MIDDSKIDTIVLKLIDVIEKEELSITDTKIVLKNLRGCFY